MKKLLGFAYGSLVYLFFLGVFTYLILFVGDVWVPRSIDAGASTSLSLPVAIAVNVGLLALFGLQHSVMARQWFKRRWTRIVPWHLERSTYVLAATLVLAVVMWGWRPIPETIWSVEDPLGSGVLRGLFWTGWGIVLLSTFLIDHFRLFGLKQVWAHLRGAELERPAFQTPALYRYVRHPLYLGFLLAFWSTPRMTAGHLLFAGVWTGWILLAIRFEERDLMRFHGEAYRTYRRRVPMLLPLGGGGADRGEELSEA
ncbi:MAG TPA: isoprenylcysteine carboxylmethyltransferase family protein [Longimicrobiales bacterium]|nr:isoprenylcysteine carboxylmethyltransferase family protein [Longimicrobiales bacterium]